mgnify:FL=1
MSATSINKKPSFYAIKIVKIIAATFLGIYLLVWAISSPVSKHFIEPALLEQGVTLSSDASINYNPFLSQLTISDLTLFTNQDNIQTKVFSINELTVQLTLFRLLFDKIVVSEFEINDAYLKVTKTPTQLIVAGIDLTKESNEEAAEPTDESEAPKETEAKPFIYQLLLPELALNNFLIEISNNDIPHVVDIKKLNVSNLQADLNAQSAHLSIQSSIDESQFELTADANLNQGQGEINSQLSLDSYPLEKIKNYLADVSELSGLFSFETKQKLVLEKNNLKLNISKANISSRDLLLGQQQQFFNLEKFENNIKDLTLSLAEGEITDLSGMSQLVLDKANIYYEKPSQKIGYFNKLALNDISLHFADEPQVKVASLVVDDILGSKNDENDHPALVTLKQFKISDIFVSAKQLAIDKINLDSLKSAVIINKDKALANLVSLPEAETKAEETANSTNEIEKETEGNPETQPKNVENTAKSEFVFSLNEFSLINENHISLLDKSIEPIKQRDLFIDSLFLGAISNSSDKQNQQTPFELTGRSNKYAKFNFSGFTQPFSLQPEHHLKGFLKELSLPTVSRYMKEAMQMELKSGQLNTDLEVNLKGEEIDGNVVILLRGLETAIADNDEAGALIDKGALPFNMALGMLKDGSGDVELEVPLSGSLSDPNFGISSIVGLITQKAIWMATQDYLMTTFVPYANIVSVAMTVGEFALKLRFDDLIYQTKQIEPSTEQKAYLDAFIGLMQEKEETRVNICAISTPADIDLTAESKITNKAHINQLKAIGEQREAAFKDYMIKHGNIDSSRLLLCAPKIDSSEKAKPRIELSV